MDLNEARKFFSGDAFAVEQAGAAIEEIGDGYALCSMEYGEKHLNAAGTVMGGAIFTLADFAFAVAANCGGTLTVSLSSQINFMAAPKGGKLFAKAQRIKSGRHTCFYSVEITDGETRKVAEVTVTGYIKEPQSGENAKPTV